MAVHGGNVEEISRQYNINSKELIDFSANINPLGISCEVKKAMIDALEKIERYPDITYFDLINSIGSYEDINTNEIVIGNGAAEIIFNIVRALKPKNALLPAPTFSEYEEALLSVDSKINYYELKEENNFKMDDGFLEKINNEIDIVFICNPNNPTGVLTSNEFLGKVLDKALKFNVNVVLDESFLDFVEENKEYTSKVFLGKYKNLIIVKSLTKFFAIPGIRIGYGLCGNNEIVEKVNKVSVPWSINIVACDGVIKALDEKEYIENTIKYVKKEKEYLYDSLKKINLLKVFEPSVNFIMFKLLDNFDLREKMIKESIIIRSCSNYKGLGNEFYRIAVRSREENDKLLKSFRNILFDK